MKIKLPKNKYGFLDVDEWTKIYKGLLRSAPRGRLTEVLLGHDNGCPCLRGRCFRECECDSLDIRFVSPESSDA